MVPALKKPRSSRRDRYWRARDNFHRSQHRFNRRTAQFELPLHAKSHLDFFAGGGGASTGWEMATGRSPDVACNHNKKTMWMHRANHPHTEHFCEDVFSFDFLAYLRRTGRPIGTCWFSPDCKHFSKAKGGALVDKKIRGLAWMLVKCAGVGGPRLKTGGRGPACPDVMWLENVEEFVTWGPLVCKRDKATGRCVKIDGSVAGKGEVVPLQMQWLVPDKKRAGKYHSKLISDLRRRGATSIEWRTLKASEYGAPTIRTRHYMIVRFDGKPIIWPEKTHGPEDSPEVRRRLLNPERIAAECIDFSIPCHSVLLSKEEAKKVRAKRPLEDSSCYRLARGVDRFVIKAKKPFIVCLTHQGQDRTESVDEPWKTVTGAKRGEKALVVPFVAHQQHGGAVRSSTKPVHTITASAKDQNQVVVVGVARQFGTGICYSVGEPLPSVMPEGGGGKNQVFACHLASHFGESTARSATEPTPTVMPGGAGKIQGVATFLAQNNGGVVGHQTYGHATTESFSTINGKGSQQSLVALSLSKYYGTEQAPKVDGPLHSATTRDRFSLEQVYLAIPPLTPELADRARKIAAWLRKYGVDVPGEFAMCGDLVIYDICMRMFVPRELYRAQGFPDDYIIDYGINEEGEKIPLSKTDQVAMCGNSVCPDVAAAIIAANVPELILEDEEKKAA